MTGLPELAELPARPADEPLGCTLFDTALGPCGLVWSGQGIVACRLPPVTLAQLQQRFPLAQPCAAWPAAVAEAIAGVQALLSGHSVDLGHVRLDERGIPAFRRQVHALTRAIPPGQTRTYGELAMALGQPGAARAVGRAEGANPFAPIVPCHRVIGAPNPAARRPAARGGQGDALTGFSAPGGIETKRRLLLIEARAVGQLAGDQQPLF